MYLKGDENLKKFKVLKEFKDIHSGDKYQVDSTVEVSDERFTEIQANLSNYDDKFIKEVKPRKSKKKAEQPTEEEGA